VLAEAELATGAYHASQLSEGRGLVGHRAHDERRHAGVDGPLLAREPMGQAVDDAHGHRGAGRRARGLLAQVGLRLHRHHLVHRAGVIPEVQAVPGAHLDHAAGEPVEHRPAVIGLALPFALGPETREEASEDRMVDLLVVARHCGG
jgi:hypothetical protein